MGWFDVQSETVTTKSGRKMHHTKSAVRKRRWSTRKRWLKRLGKAALAGVAAVGLKTYANHLKHKSQEKVVYDNLALRNLINAFGEQGGKSKFELIKHLDDKEQESAVNNFLIEKRYLEYKTKFINRYGLDGLAMYSELYSENLPDNNKLYKMYQFLMG